MLSLQSDFPRIVGEDASFIIILKSPIPEHYRAVWFREFGK